MDDLAEQRAGELEALESIYANDFRLVSLTADPDDLESAGASAGGDLASFEIDIRSREVPTGPGGAPEIATCCLRFEYTADYPASAPQFAVLDTQNLTDADLEAIRDLMEATCQACLGEVMVFSVVSAVQDALQDAAGRLEDTRRMVEERRVHLLEEEERKKFVGTPVTTETFAEWKRRFEEEMTSLKARKLKEVAAGKKPTGKELFLADNRFDVSDLQILQEEGGEPVEVDESLFQSLDDLELQDEEGVAAGGGDDD